MVPVRARDYRDEVAEQTDARILLNPEDLFKGLYNCRGLKTEPAKTNVMGQVEMAKQRKAHKWLGEAAYFATTMFERHWVEVNIGRVGRKPSGRTKPVARAEKSRPTTDRPLGAPTADKLSASSEESPKRSWKMCNLQTNVVCEDPSQSHQMVFLE